MRTSFPHAIEDRIDKIIVELYEISEGYRIEREKREAEHRRYLEEQQRIRELAEIKEMEKQKTQELENEAKDYQIACEIRNYIAALKEKNKSDETEWCKSEMACFLLYNGGGCCIIKYKVKSSNLM